MHRLSLARGAASGVAELSPDDVRTASRLADLLLEVARSVDRDMAAAFPSRLGGDPQLDALRSVLLEQDRAAFDALRQKIDDPQQFAEAISAVLANALALAEARDDRLAAVLAPAMERAAHGAIRKDVGPLVGVLYPLVGPVIRKSIAESLDGTLRRLNQAFKDSFSWRGLKWRLEAFRSGSTYADVVLKHTVVYRVEHLFLIHRESGLLLEHVAAAEAESQDPHMVSGMLTAIQDFVRDSFGKSASDGSGIDSLRLGDLLLWCEEGPLALLAAVIRGNPPESLHGALRETLAGIHQDLLVPLQSFSGDSATLGDLGNRLGPCLQQQEQPRDTRLSPWLWAIPLVVLVLGGAWLAYRTLIGYRVDTYVEALRAEPGIVVTTAERRNGTWYVAGLRDPLATDPATLRTQSKLTTDQVVESWETYQALNPAIVMKRMAATLNPPRSVTLTLVGDAIRAEGSAPEHWVEKARALIAAMPAGAPAIDLGSLKDVQDPDFIRLRDAIQAHVITFASNAPRPPVGQDAVLDALASELGELIRVAKGLGFSVRVMIVGHADATGQETSNLALSAARAEVVRSMLKSRGIAPHLLLVRSAGALEPEQAGAAFQALAANRRVTFVVSTSD
ncbi:MAG TPA: OmpA family protein [Vicinamibacterales bacterium]|nr:OmpA family protein [Vicinamibacterales bacterium]